VKEASTFSEHNAIARLVFKSETVHPGTYAKVFTEGSMPMQAMYDLLAEYRENLDIPKEMKKTWRASYLKLLGFYPSSYDNLMIDAWAMQKVGERGMFVVEETTHESRVRDVKKEN
jgi:hypothetical protein